MTRFIATKSLLWLGLYDGTRLSPLRWWTREKKNSASLSALRVRSSTQTRACVRPKTDGRSIRFSSNMLRLHVLDRRIHAVRMDGGYRADPARPGSRPKADCMLTHSPREGTTTRPRSIRLQLTEPGKRSIRDVLGLKSAPGRKGKMHEAAKLAESASTGW